MRFVNSDRIEDMTSHIWRRAVRATYYLRELFFSHPVYPPTHNTHPEPKVEKHFAFVTLRLDPMADQDEEEFYIKGYKVDREKLLNNFTPLPDDLQNVRYMCLWQKFPTEFLYLASGKEPEGRISLVVVLADGYDKEKLEQVPIVDLREPYTKIFTPGIWAKYD